MGLFDVCINQLLSDPAVRSMTGDASVSSAMYIFNDQHFPGVTTETVLIYRLQSCVRSMAFITIQTGHGDFRRK